MSQEKNRYSINLIDKNIKNIVFIGLKKTKEGKTLINIRGTGLIIKPDIILTCAHIYKNIPEEERDDMFCGVMGNLDNKVHNYKRYDIEFIDKDKNNDLAIFKIKDFEKELNEYGIKKDLFGSKDEIQKIKQGKDVFFSGFSLANNLINMGMGITLTTNKCVISNTKYKSNGDLNFLLIDKLVNPGGSGSPVFYNSKIIGLAAGTIHKTHNISGLEIKIPVGIGIVRPSNYIIELLNG